MNEHKTKEEILSQYECEAISFIRRRTGNEYVLIVHTGQAMKVMEEYADQQTSSLTQQLADKDKEIEDLKQSIIMLCKKAYFDASPMMKTDDLVRKHAEEWIEKNLTHKTK